MSIEHTTRAITENKYLMQLFADKKSLEADIAVLKNLKGSNPSDPRTSDFIIKQKEYELSQIESRTKGKDYSSVKNQCEKYFTDNASLFDKNQIITETRSMLAKGQIVNEWPHLAAVFLLDHAIVTDTIKAGIAAVIPPTSPAIATPIPESKVVATDLPGFAETIEPATIPTAPTNQRSPVVPQKQRSTLIPKTSLGDLPEIFKVNQTMVLKDGAYYLTGPKGNTRRVDMQSLLVNFNLPKDAPENLQKSVSLVQDFALILDAYLLKNPDKKEQYSSTLKGIQADFANPDVQSGNSILDIKKWAPTLFGNNNFLKDSDLYVINRVLENTDPKARKFAVLSFIRGRLGQSDLVAQKLMEDTMSRFGFPPDDVIVKNGNLSSTMLDAKQITKVRETINKARSEANSNWIKNKENYLQVWKSQNPGKSVDEELARVANEKLTIIMSAKREIVYQNLYNKKNLPQELALLQNILGADSMKMSDRSWEISQDVAGMIAIEAIAIGAGVVTAGLGTAAINALAFGRHAYKGVRALEAYNAASSTKQYLTTGARILGGGAAFEVGGATTRSLIENRDFTSMHSKEGYAQSIAMMGVMRGLGHIFEKTGILALQNGVGIAKNIIPFAGQVAIEGTAIFGTSATIGSVFFDRRDNWTLEQMAQAMLMATIFKGAGRVFAGKNKNGEIEVKKSTEEIVSHGKKDVIPEGTLKSEPIKSSENIVDISKFTNREITTTDVRRTKNLIKNSHYPQFIAEDGSIWSIRSVTGKSGSEMVEIGPLGVPSVARKATIQEFVEGVNINVRKFRNSINTTTVSNTAVDAKTQPINTVMESVATPKTETVNKPSQEKSTGTKNENNPQAAPHIEGVTAKNAINKAEKATIDDIVTQSEKQNFITKYGSEKWEALSQSFKDAPKGIGNGAKSIFGVVTGIGRSTVSWKGATIGTGITEVIEASFNLNGTERDWNPMSEDGIKNIGGMLWQILAYRYMGIVRGFIVTEGYRVIPAVYTQVRDANK